MKKVNINSVALAVVCLFFVNGLVTGCASTKKFLGFVKFWESKDTAAIKELEAKEVFAFLSKVRPTGGNPDSHYLLADHYQQRGRHKEAIEEFKKVLLIDAQCTGAYNGMGVSYDNLREFDKAQEAYRTAMNLAPQQHYLYNNLGYSLILKGDYEAAVEVLQKGAALSQGNVQVHNNLAMAYAALGINDRALTELERTNKPAEARFMLAQIHHQQGRFEAEEYFYNAAVSLDPSLKSAIPDADRFAAQVSRSIKDAGQVNTESSKKILAPLKVPEEAPHDAESVDSSATTTRVLSMKTNIIKRLTTRRQNIKTVTLQAHTLILANPKIVKLEPFFLMNKTLKITSNKNVGNGLRVRSDEQLMKVIGELFPIQCAKATISTDQWMGRKWF